MSVATELSIASGRKAFFALAAVLFNYRVSFGEMPEASMFFDEVFDLRSEIDFASLYAGTLHLSEAEVEKCRKVLAARVSSEHGQDLAARKPLSGKLRCLDTSVLGKPDSWSLSSKEALVEAIERNNWTLGSAFSTASLLSRTYMSRDSSSSRGSDTRLTSKRRSASESPGGSRKSATSSEKRNGAAKPSAKRSASGKGASATQGTKASDENAKQRETTAPKVATRKSAEAKAATAKKETAKKEAAKKETGNTANGKSQNGRPQNALSGEGSSLNGSSRNGSTATGSAANGRAQIGQSSRAEAPAASVASGRKTAVSSASAAAPASTVPPAAGHGQRSSQSAKPGSTDAVAVNGASHRRMATAPTAPAAFPQQSSWLGTSGIAVPTGILGEAANSSLPFPQQKFHRQRLEYLRQIYQSELSCGLARFEPIDAAVVVASRTGLRLEELLIPCINGLSHLSGAQANQIGSAFPKLNISALSVWTAAS